MRWCRLWTAGTLGILAFCALPVLSCGDSSQAAEPESSDQAVIRFGAALSLSGRFSRSGRYVRDGYEFAVHVINQRGGVMIGDTPHKIALKYLDDMSEASRASAIIESMVKDEGIQLLLGPYSTQLTQAVEPIAERYRIPMVEAGAAGSSLFERGYRHLFSVLTTTEHYMDDMFELANKKAAPKLGKRPEDMTVGLAVHDDRFSRDLREEVLSEVDKHNMRLVIDDRLPADPTDLSMTVDRMKLLEPDIMVISGHERAALAAIETIDRHRITIPMLAVTHCHPANLIQVRPEESEGVFCPMQWHPKVPYQDDIFGSAREYASKFHQRYGYPPPYQAAQASAAVVVYVRALEKCDSLDPAVVRDTLAELEIDTFYGPVDFDDRGRNTAKPLLLMQVIDGEYVMIAPRHLGKAEPRIVRPPAR